MKQTSGEPTVIKTKSVDKQRENYASATIQQVLPGPSMMLPFLLFILFPMLLLGIISALENGVILRDFQELVDMAKNVNAHEVSSKKDATNDLISKKELDASQLARGEEENSRLVQQKRAQQNHEQRTVQQKRKNQNTPSSGGRSSQEQQRLEVDNYINQLRITHKNDPTDFKKAVQLAEVLRQRDMQYHDGGSTQMECIEMFNLAVQMTLDQRTKFISGGESTDVLNENESDTPLGYSEMFIDINSKSNNGRLASLHCSLGKIYYMANMFEESSQSYDSALEYKPNDLDALTYRAGSNIILGKYEDAAVDYLRVLELDANTLRIFCMDAYTGLAKILAAKEDAVDKGWDVLVESLDSQIPHFYQLMDGNSSAKNPHGQSYADQLKKMHLAMFAYHDFKTKDTDKAFDHLSKAYKLKMLALPPYNSAIEKQRVDTVKQIFHTGFWSMGAGSTSKTPIFIIGFVRSGSTLLERILDAHPQIVGTGEDSVMNGRLDYIRNEIVDASRSGDPRELSDTIDVLADFVTDTTIDRWKKTSKTNKGQRTPKRFVDKMLTNYMNIGFIHLLFPNALILHVAREPMDTIFSAYKHDFPPGGLDYTSDFQSLAHMYDHYRTIMDHWDNVLPGRVTHVRYNDLVRDMPTVAKSIIKATGLEWHDEILNFHKRKQAVNTLSTTQVRKGIYTDSIQAWMKYEEHLQPLVKMVGKNVEYLLKTSLKGYSPPKELKDEL